MGEKCPKCQTCVTYGSNRENVGTVGEHDRLPGNLCQACETEISEHKQLVAEGGIYFKCAECPATGVVKGSTELAKAVRRAMKIDPPAPCGVEFETCAEHTVQ